jgi:hypothetical protein
MGYTVAGLIVALAMAAAPEDQPVAVWVDEGYVKGLLERQKPLDEYFAVQTASEEAQQRSSDNE